MPMADFFFWAQDPKDTEFGGGFSIPQGYYKVHFAKTFGKVWMFLQNVVGFCKKWAAYMEIFEPHWAWFWGTAKCQHLVSKVKACQ
jgi:hypothetical protein